MEIIEDQTYNKIINNVEKYLDSTDKFLELSAKYNEQISNYYKTKETSINIQNEKLNDQIYKLNENIKTSYELIINLIFEYIEKYPKVTLKDLELKFRKDNEDLYLIASTQSNIDQSNIDQSNIDQSNNDKLNNDKLNNDKLNNDKLNNDKLNNDKLNKYRLELIIAKPEYIEFEFSKFDHETNLNNLEKTGFIVYNNLKEILDNIYN